MQITTYSLKGAPLTIAEMDRNFSDLRDAILAVVGGVHVTGWHQDDNDALFFEYSDGQKIGPIILPTKTLRLRGAWRTGEVYAEHDVYVSDGTSYLVGVLHMSTTIAADVAAGHVGVLAAKGDAPADAPANGKLFGRRDGQWIEIVHPEGSGAGGIADAPSDGKDYIRRDGSWSLLTHPETPATGGIAEAPDDGKSYVRSGKAWTVLPAQTGGGGTGIADAPADGTVYGRRNGEWVVVPAGGGVGIEEAPENGRPHVRQDGAWIEMPASDGGTGTAGFMAYRGVYQGFQDYAFGDVVSLSDDSYWLCIKAVGQGGDTPSIPEPGQQSNASWRLLTWPGPEAQYAQGGSIRVRTSGSTIDSLANVVADLRLRIADLEAAR